MFGLPRIVIAFLILVLLLPLLGFIGMLLSGVLSHRDQPPAPPAAAPYDEKAAIEAAEKITPAMIGYDETDGIKVPFREPRAIAVDSEDRIFVAGDRGVTSYSSNGKKLFDIDLKTEPQCLVVECHEDGTSGQLFVGMKEHVEVFDRDGERAAIWPSRDGSLFTSIAITDYEVWVADSKSRVVWCYDLHGKLLSPLGKIGSKANGPEFDIVDRYFDVAAGRDGLLYVVNPGQLRVEPYTRDGYRETPWGENSPAVAGFFGRDNPAHLAILPDGNFVTAEQGIPRVKVYSHRGDFRTVVAGPQQLTETPAGVAGDRQGRIFILDAHAAKVRIFEKKKQPK